MARYVLCGMYMDGARPRNAWFCRVLGRKVPGMLAFVAAGVASPCTLSCAPAESGNSAHHAKFALEHEIYTDNSTNECMKRFIESVSEYNYFFDNLEWPQGMVDDRLTPDPRVPKQVVQMHASIYEPSHQGCQGSNSASFLSSQVPALFPTATSSDALAAGIKQIAAGESADRELWLSPSIADLATSYLEEDLEEWGYRKVSEDGRAIGDAIPLGNRSFLLRSYAEGSPRWLRVKTSSESRDYQTRASTYLRGAPWVYPVETALAASLAANPKLPRMFWNDSLIHRVEMGPDIDKWKYLPEMRIKAIPKLLTHCGEASSNRKYLVSSSVLGSRRTEDWLRSQLRVAQFDYLGGRSQWNEAGLKQVISTLFFLRLAFGVDYKVFSSHVQNVYLSLDAEGWPSGPATLSDLGDFEKITRLQPHPSSESKVRFAIRVFGFPINDVGNETHLNLASGSNNLAMDMTHKFGARLLAKLLLEEDNANNVEASLVGNGFNSTYQEIHFDLPAEKARQGLARFDQCLKSPSCSDATSWIVGHSFKFD